MKHFVSILLLIALTGSAIGITCPRGFSAVNNQKCLRLFNNNMKHLEAENDCSYLGGTLVTIKTAIDNRAVTNMAASASAQNVWIGVYCFAVGNTTTCYHDDNSGVLNYTSFAAGNPAVQANGGCVYMATTGKNAGQWFSAPCEVIGMPFVCEVPPTFADKNCTRNYYGYCYMPSHEIKSSSTNTTSYDEAESICEANGGTLASIHSKPELDYIRAIYRNTNIQKIFLGAQAFLPDTFDWQDGTNWDYDYTNPLATTSGDCLQMDLTAGKPNNGMWSETDCGSNLYFLCKRRITPTPGVMAQEVKKQGRVNPKFRKSRKALPHRQELLDFSNCNSTLYMSPGVITSFGYPNSKPPVAYCTWTVAALGPYRVGIYFTDFSVYQDVYIYDEFGNVVSAPSGTQRPFQVLGDTNLLRLVHDSRYDANYGYTGFSATVLPF
ncbi:hypothetical protein CAEBREN_23669 [Caenorhabditis brenneri]|uniref:C-type LECtin n=1 Tax=Caenorhabditis brenneri TaxID=135651 RepID=G0MDV5_CAEBE|nr:hypothetical protein CAEBREN_23669 [Caenorhabditis brenneri]